MHFKKKIKIFIADDHPVVRNGIIGILEKEPDIDIVGEAGNGSQIELLLSNNVPDILLLDLNMPDLDPIATTRQVTSTYKSIKVLVLTAYDDDAYVNGLLEAGACGYIIKEEALDMLLVAIRTVANGESWISQRIAGRIMRNSLTCQKSKDVEKLTEREYEILRLIALGSNNDDIAEKLFITKRTVQNHVSNIYAKLFLTSRAEAILYAIRQNIVNVSEVKGI